MIDAAGKRISPFWIQTFTGRAFNLDAPTPEQVCARDIAHALALLNRYCGHSLWPYSVAQHSIMVAEIVAATAPELALAALLHDAPEAYLNDWSSPLKAIMRDWQANGAHGQAPLYLDEAIGDCIRARYRINLGPAERRLIKHADLVALATEKRDLFGPAPQEGWGDATGFELPEPLAAPCQEWSWLRAEAGFLRAFDAYGGVQP